jgi:fluoride ion exporter CrcB/FEX
MNEGGTTAMATTVSATEHHDEQVAPELTELNLPDKPDGPGAAMMISAGVGILVLGFLTVLGEASAGAKTWLQKWEWGEGVGPLAGKTTLAALAYIVSLVVLWIVWRAKNVNLKTAFYVGLALGILGAIGTYPTFFQKFTP